MNNYQPGAGGVNIVKNPLQLADNELVEAKNAEFHPDSALGGEAALTKRGGFTRLFTSALAGAIYGFISLTFESLPVPTFWVTDTAAWESEDTDMPVSIVGGSANNSAAVADTSDATYVRFAGAITADTFIGSAIELDFAAITAPASGKTHTLVVRARRTTAITDPDIDYTDIEIALKDTAGIEVVKQCAVTKADFDSAGTAFTDFEFELTAGEVTDLEAVGYDDLRINLSVGIDTNDINGITETVTIDIARVYIEIEA